MSSFLTVWVTPRRIGVVLDVHLSAHRSRRFAAAYGSHPRSSNAFFGSRRATASSCQSLKNLLWCQAAATRGQRWAATRGQRCTPDNSVKCTALTPVGPPAPNVGDGMETSRAVGVNNTTIPAV